MSYTNPNDPINRDTVDPLTREAIPNTTSTTVIDRRSEGGMSWFIVGALVIAAGVLAYLYFGNDTNTASTGTATEAPADTGRASTPATPTESESAPAPAAPSGSSEMAPGNAAPAPDAPPAPRP